MSKEKVVKKRFPSFKRLERAVQSFRFKETDRIIMTEMIEREKHNEKYPSRKLIIEYLKLESENLPSDYN
ncbi:MAG: hypothetical protein KKC19_03135 [Nanoarchaeota archaeon]|nr:hypothetical protein [Nanoarchaeota archaeon]